MMSIVEDFLTFYADPGEDFGWALGCGTTLLSAGTDKMWSVADDLDHVLVEGNSAETFLHDLVIRKGIDPKPHLQMKIGRVVSEDFRIYPWAAKQLAWDRVRTARVIGAMQYMTRKRSVPFILQPAAIKPAAVAAGAEELYYRPLRENRHQNDAIQHFVFYTSTELLGLYLPVPDQTEDS
jgi:hypothetical protein